MNHVCLNCNEPLQGNFCIHCGQSAKTHRFTIKHIFTKDVIFAIFHVNRGLLFSIKELFTRPGHSVREYVSGKRVTHLNYFTLLVIVLLIFSLVEHLTPFHFADLIETDKEILERFEALLKKYPKVIYMGIIPFYALFSFLIFKRANQNYAEHFVLNTFKVSALLVINTVFILFATFSKDILIVKKVDSILLWLIMAYGTWFYYQYFHSFYQHKFMLLMKSVLCAVLPGIFLTTGIIVYLLLTNEASI